MSSLLEMYGPDHQPRQAVEVDYEAEANFEPTMRKKSKKKLYRRIGRKETNEYRRSNTQSKVDWITILVLWIIVGVLHFTVPISKQCVNGYDDNVVDDNQSKCGDGVTHDPQLEKPLLAMTVPFSILILISVLVWLLPIVISVAYLLTKNRNAIHRWKKIAKHVLILFKCYLFSVGVSLFLSEPIKNMVGRPRPNFFAIADDSEWSGQAYLSFPSGHSSYALAAFLPLTLFWLEAVKYVRFGCDLKTNSYDNPLAYVGAFVWDALGHCYVLSVVLCCVPTVIAIWVCVTRVTDYWHHYGDVLAGALIGITSAFLACHIFKDEFFAQKVDTKMKISDQMDINIVPDTK